MIWLSFNVNFNVECIYLDNIFQNWWTKIKSYFQINQNGELKLDLIFVIILIVASTLATSSYREYTNEIMWDRDDAYSILIANSFRDTGDFYFLIESFKDQTANQIIQSERPVLLPFGEKGPLYFVILGSVFSIIDSDATNWYQTASLLNGIFTTIFLVLLYFFLKKYFGIHVAFYSSFIISLLPYFIFQGSVVRPIILFLIFTVSSFYFLNHKKSHYVIFGILSALAHLTHPFGIILPLSYFTILIINKIDIVHLPSIICIYYPYTTPSFQTFVSTTFSY